MVVLVGVAWRLLRYLLCFPVWGDEAMLLVNYPGRGFLDLAGPLEHCQVAPLLFHWAELVALRVLGTGELALRLPPLVACLGSLVLFAVLARLLLPPVARGLAVAILAVSIWPATLGSLVKPYTFDLFFSLALLVPAALWHRRPARLLPLVGLVLVVSVAVLASYPAVFVAAAVSLACLPLMWRGGSRKAWALFLLYNALLAGTFLAHYLLVARAQLDSPVRGSTTAQEMAAYWHNGFPPGEPVALIRWLVLALTGQMAAYPIGAAAGGSIATVLLALLGGWRLRRRWFIGLVAVLFGLGLIAAAVRGYPFGTSCRLAQHLAPVYCLLVGRGLAVLLARQRCAVIAAFAVLTLVAVVGIGRDLWRPYRDAESLWARHLTTAIAEKVGDDSLVAITTHERTFPLLRWQIGLRGHAVFRADTPTCPDLSPKPSSLWVLAVDLPGDEVSALLERSGRSWWCVEQSTLSVPEPVAREPLPRACLSRWVCEAK
jgi:hypothetical protein